MNLSYKVRMGRVGCSSLRDRTNQVALGCAVAGCSGRVEKELARVQTATFFISLRRAKELSWTERKLALLECV